MKKTEKLPIEANARLVEVRKALGLTREEMASLLHFTYQSYGFIERGASPLFLDRLEPLRNTEGNIDYIVKGEGEPLNPTKTEVFLEKFARLPEDKKDLIRELVLSWSKEEGK